MEPNIYTRIFAKEQELAVASTMLVGARIELHEQNMRKRAGKTHSLQASIDRLQKLQAKADLLEQQLQVLNDL